MTGADVLAFPGSVALIAAIALVLAMVSAGLYAIVDFLARALTDHD